MQRVEPVVVTRDDVLVLPHLPEIAKDADALGQLRVVGDDGPRITQGTEVLARIEAEAGGTAERTGASAAVAGAVRLRGVLDQRDACRVGDLRRASMSAGCP